MAVSIYIVSKAGGMIYQYEHNFVPIEYEKTFSYPLDIVLDFMNNRVVVTFGQVDNIKGKHLIFFWCNLPNLNAKLCVS